MFVVNELIHTIIQSQCSRLQRLQFCRSLLLLYSFSIVFTIEVVSYLAFQISSYYTRRGRGNLFVLITTAISIAISVSILAVYVNDIYA